MPKEYINFPLPTAYAYAEGEAPREPDPAAPQVGIHWDGHPGTVQLSLDIDFDTLARIVDRKRADPKVYDGSEEGRQIFYTESLSRQDLQRLIKHARRARDAAFGADE